MKDYPECRWTANGYKIASKLSFYSGVMVPSLNIRNRPNQFDYGHSNSRISSRRCATWTIGMCSRVWPCEFLGRDVDLSEGNLRGNSAEDENQILIDAQATHGHCRPRLISCRGVHWLAYGGTKSLGLRARSLIELAVLTGILELIVRVVC